MEVVCIVQQKMGFCGSCFRVFGYFMVALQAFCVYFYLECQHDSEENIEAIKKVDKVQFNPDGTDAKDIPLGFCKDRESRNTDLGA